MGDSPISSETSKGRKRKSDELEWKCNKIKILRNQVSITFSN